MSALYQASTAVRGLDAEVHQGAALGFENVIKITCPGWVTPVLPPIPRIGCSETLKSVLQAECFVLEYFLSFWPLLHEWLGS